MSVTLLDSMGTDLDVVNAARVSLARRSAEMGEAEVGLVSYLMRERHGTPFEMVEFRFHVHVPIGVAREWQRHRIGSFNEVSTRYVEMRPDFYVPTGEAVRTQIGKAGHYQMVAVAPHSEQYRSIQSVTHAAYDQAYAAYEQLLAYGLAREVARNVLPLGLLTEFIWKVNLRSLLNFLSLRTAPTALYEIRQEACEVERLVEAIVPAVMRFWNEHGRKSV